MEWADRIGRRIKLRDLHVLVAAVQSGSMTKAAASLAISVPVVSKAIADLEHALGVRLLDRSARGVEPTPYGSALIESGLAAFDELRQGVKRIEFLADPGLGEVRIGCPVTMATGFVSVVIDQLSRKYPRIVVHLLASERRRLPRARRAQSRFGDRGNLRASERRAIERRGSVRRTIRDRGQLSIRLGKAAQRDSSPSSSTSVGRCRLRTPCSDRSWWRRSGQKGSSLRRQWSSRHPFQRAIGWLRPDAS